MTIEELYLLKKNIIKLNALNIIFNIINVLLIIIPFYHYLNNGFQFDNYFIIITILNVIGFYVSFKLANKLIYFKLKHKHFTEKLNTK